MSGFAQDVVTRIVNVQWGGAGFTTGTGAGIFKSGSPKDAPLKWSHVLTEFDPIDEDNYGAAGQHSYGLHRQEDGSFISIILAGGVTAKGKGIIMLSHKGDSWSEVYGIGGNRSHSESGATVGMLAHCTGIVWSPNDGLFYAAITTFDLVSDIVEGAEQIHNFMELKILSSADGSHWSDSYSTGRIDSSDALNTDAAAAAVDTFTSTFKNFCSNAKPQNAFAGGVPDGYIAIDLNNVTMRPASLIGWSAEPNIGVSYSEENKNSVIVTGGDRPGLHVVPLDHVSSVAFGGGLWCAAGTRGNQNAVASSTDAGLTWDVSSSFSPADPSGDAMIGNGIIAARLSI
jgi:hypothetical protein